MAVSERDRRELQEALVGSIGPEPTDTLLGYLPPVGWSDVVTRRDLDALGAGLRGEIQRLDGKVDALAARLTGKIDALGNRLNGRIDRLEGRIDGLEGRIDGLASKFGEQLHHELHKQDRWLIALTITIVLALFGQTLTLVSLRFFG